jgi:TPR repeat protein
MKTNGIRENKMYKLCSVLLSLFFVIEGCAVSSSYPDGLDPYMYELALQAMAGDGEAANSVAVYYNDYQYYDIANEWEMIGAENGRANSQWNTAYHISYPANISATTRAVFWLRVLTKNGDIGSKKELESHGISVNFDFPPDSSFPASHVGMSAATISYCKEGALKGSGKAALLLAQYYSGTNSGESEYWYRIGAQNGNSECQHNLGLIYQAKPEKLNKTRGTFWLEAAKKGYKL